MLVLVFVLLLLVVVVVVLLLLVLLLLLSSGISVLLLVNSATYVSMCPVIAFHNAPIGDLGEINSPIVPIISRPN